jgi:cytochrome c
MRRMLGFLVGSMAFLLLANVSSAAEQATPEEVVERVNKAIDMVKKDGEKSFATLQKKDSFTMWKDTYIFVFDCSKGEIMTHPEKPSLIGKNLMSLKDPKGNLFFVQMCNSAKDPKGGWTEYWWPKAGEEKASRKLSLLKPVPNSKYQVGAGVYSETAKVEDLKKLLN